MERSPPAAMRLPPRLKADSELLGVCQALAAASTVQMPAADASTNPATASTAAPTEAAAAATGGSRGPRRHSKDDNFVHDGTGIFMPAAIVHTAHSDDDFLLTEATALRCPWSDKRHARRVSHHGDASDPLLPPGDEPKRHRVTLTGTEHLQADTFLLPPAAKAAAGRAFPPTAGKAAARKHALPIMIAPEGVSTCYITVE